MNAATAPDQEGALVTDRKVDRIFLVYDRGWVAREDDFNFFMSQTQPRAGTTREFLHNGLALVETVTCSSGCEAVVISRTQDTSAVPPGIDPISRYVLIKDPDTGAAFRVVYGVDSDPRPVSVMVSNQTQTDRRRMLSFF